MDSEDNQMIEDDYNDEDLDSLVQRANDWDLISDWQALLLAKKQSYVLSRINSLGYEYYNDTRQWDVIIDREWNILENRYNSGLGLEEEIIESFGKDFFTKKKELEDEMDLIASEMEQRDYGSEQLTVYTYEDFLLLSNQGIFRDEVFIVDPQRKWKSKVIEHLKDYGYNHFEKIDIQGRRCIVVSKTTE